VSESGAESVIGGGYPGAASAAAAYDELDYQRAVQAYVWAVPLVNVVGLVRALVEGGVSLSEPSLYVFDRHVTPKQVLMTANSEVIYAFTAFDLNALGPVVIDAPVEAFGAVMDVWSRGIVDIGIGPARGKRILIAPAGFSGAVPDDCYVAHSRTNVAVAFARAIVPPGQEVGPSVELLSGIRLSRLGGDGSQTRVVLGGGRPFDSDWPKDARYFDYMADGLGYAGAESGDRLMYAMLAPLGIGPAATSQPDERARAIFERAASTGAVIVSTLAFACRAPLRKPWAERRWEPISTMTTFDAETSTAIELDARAQGYYQLVGNGLFGFTMHAPPNLTAAVPGTGTTVPGSGSWYAQTYRDSGDDYLLGGRSYRLRLASPPPVAQFWSATVYDTRSRSMIDTDQQRAGLSSLSHLTTNPDGSIDLYFAPDPPEGLGGNWIETIPGQGLLRDVPSLRSARARPRWHLAAQRHRTTGLAPALLGGSCS
jgi:hypothetical protein